MSRVAAATSSSNRARVSARRLFESGCRQAEVAKAGPPAALSVPLRRVCSRFSFAHAARPFMYESLIKPASRRVYGSTMKYPAISR